MTWTHKPRLYDHIDSFEKPPEGILDGVLHSIDGLDVQEWIYTHGVGERGESLRNSHGVLYECSIIIEVRNHLINDSRTFFAIFETILYF